MVSDAFCVVPAKPGDKVKISTTVMLGSAHCVEAFRMWTFHVGADVACAIVTAVAPQDRLASGGRSAFPTFLLVDPCDKFAPGCNLQRTCAPRHRHLRTEV